MNKLLAGTAMGTLAVLAWAGDAQAGFINSFGWVSTEAIVSSATGGSPASLALATCHMGAAACTAANADVTFTTNGIDFSDNPVPPAPYHRRVVGSNPNPKTGLPFHNGVTGATAMDPTLWQFTGTAHFTAGEKFSFKHDDGVTMIVNGVTQVSQAGPTSPTTTTATYSGATGNFSFDIVYAECCGGPQVLKPPWSGLKTHQSRNRPPSLCSVPPWRASASSCADAAKPREEPQHDR